MFLGLLACPAPPARLAAICPGSAGASTPHLPVLSHRGGLAPPPRRPRLTRMAASWSAYTPDRVKNARVPVKLVPGPKKTEQAPWMVVDGGEARPENEADDRAVEVRLIEAGKAAVDKRIEEELGEVGAMLTYAVPEAEFGTLPPNHILKFLVTRRADIEAYAESVRKETTAKLLEAGGLKAKPRKELDFLAGIPYEFVQKVTNFFNQNMDVVELLEEIDENTAELLRKGEDGRTLADDWRIHTDTVQDMTVFGDIMESRFFSPKDQEIFTSLRQATQAQRDHPAWKTLLFSELPDAGWMHEGGGPGSAGHTPLDAICATLKRHKGELRTRVAEIWVRYEENEAEAPEWADENEWWKNPEDGAWYYRKEYRQVVSLAICYHHMTYKMTAKQIYTAYCNLPVLQPAKGRVQSRGRAVQQQTAHATRKHTVETINSWLAEMKLDDPMGDPVKWAKEAVKAMVNAVVTSNHKLGFTNPFLRNLPYLAECTESHEALEWRAVHDERVVLPLAKMSKSFQRAIIQALPDALGQAADQGVAGDAQVQELRAEADDREPARRVVLLLPRLQGGAAGRHRVRLRPEQPGPAVAVQGLRHQLEPQLIAQLHVRAPLQGPVPLLLLPVAPGLRGRAEGPGDRDHVRGLGRRAHGVLHEVRAQPVPAGQDGPRRHQGAPDRELGDLPGVPAFLLQGLHDVPRGPLREEGRGERGADGPLRSEAQGLADLGHEDDPLQAPLGQVSRMHGPFGIGWLFFFTRTASNRPRDGVSLTQRFPGSAGN